MVIGAGQAGLSVSFYLKRLGLEPGSDFVLLDRGPGTGGAWQHRWEALRIGSAHHINDLPGMDEIGISFDSADRSLPAKDVVADYYARYEAHYELQVRRPVDVKRVFNRGTDLVVGFEASGGIGALETDVVVNATGTWGSPFVPWYPGLNDFAGRHVHTTQYDSAADFAHYLVAKNFRVDLSYRKPELSRMNDINLADLRGMAAAGRLEFLMPTDITGIEADAGRPRAMFQQVEPRVYDHVVYALGGSTPAGFLQSTGIDLKGGEPVLGEGGATNVRGLFLAGDLTVGKKGGSIISAFNSGVRTMRVILREQLLS